jgi:hypothetical protein
MEIPDDTERVIRLLMDSEDRWKARYMAVWAYSYYLRFAYEGPSCWDVEIDFGLPRSQYKKHTFTPNKLYNIVTSQDTEFALEHLTILFILFEELVNEAVPILYPGDETDACYFANLRDFLKAENQFKDKIKFVTDEEFYEVDLAKKTRNCFIHGGKINGEFIDAYKRAKGREPATGGEGELEKAFHRDVFHEIEDWHKLIIGIVVKIKSAIEAK